MSDPASAPASTITAVGSLIAASNTEALRG